MSLFTKDFDYELPQELIAERPLDVRSESRMLVVHRQSGRIEHLTFSNFSDHLGPDDLVVLNNTKVIPARVYSDDGRIELLCLDRLGPLEWRCLVRPGKRMKPGHTIQVGGITGTVTSVCENGDRLIYWDSEIDLNTHGQLALPHYMGREQDDLDRDRYQTVYAQEEGAIAAPTAGLHFTPELLEKIPHAFLTLHVGVGTFRPVSVEKISEHVMHSERYRVSEGTTQRINSAHRITAVGTTVTRVLESLRPPDNTCRILSGEHCGETDIFIHPPHVVGSVDRLLTNFHLPQSTLLMLVCAFAGQNLMMEAYRQAVAERYRFYSYGDCMLIL